MKQRYFRFTAEPSDLQYVTEFFLEDKQRRIADEVVQLDAGETIYKHRDNIQSASSNMKANRNLNL